MPMFDGVPKEQMKRDYGELAPGSGSLLFCNGAQLRCDCGCDLFRQYVKHPEIRRCAWCGVMFEVELKKEDEASRD